MADDVAEADDAIGGRRRRVRAQLRTAHLLNDAVTVCCDCVMTFWVRCRAIIVQDVVHIKRPDMQQIDAMLHVDANATAEVCGLLMVFNPAFDGANATARLHLPLYYTGETVAVMLSQEEGPGRRTPLRRDFSVALDVELPPLGITYFVVRRLKTAVRLLPARAAAP